MATNAERVHRDSGKASRLAANRVISELDSVGISVPVECERQLVAGVASFAGSLDSLFQLLGDVAPRCSKK